jgi:Spy/CpxP family protein refolding chaperone
MDKPVWFIEARSLKVSLMKQLFSRLDVRASLLAGMALVILLLSTLTLNAQDASPTPQSAPPPPFTSLQSGDLATQLNLAPDQVDRIRAVTAESKEQRQAANRRVFQAKRALDEAIYQDNADETVISARAKDLADAQAVALRLQSLNLYRIRQVLTPQQLSTLRDLRRQAREIQQQRRRQELLTNPNATGEALHRDGGFLPRRMDNSNSRPLGTPPPRNGAAGMNSTQKGNGGTSTVQPAPPDQ